jgi:Protein of unknown function (DUF1553)/Protein of unknown function (DUF1549)
MSQTPRDDSSLPLSNRRTIRAIFGAMLLLSTSVGLALFAAAPEQSTPAEPALTAADRAHWAFRPLAPVAPPAVTNDNWCRTPIDRFILHKLESLGLAPQPEADRRVLIRRVSFDLTGLPPTPTEIDAFIADIAPGAYERLIDRLLDSSAYGERWAQHWLDLVRFAETDGFEHDAERPNAWRYRDWVIAALNDDLPYNEFIRWQLAGDEVRPDDERAAIATGYLLCGPDMPDINLIEERRHNFLNDMTGTVGSTLLGLQVGCAQCHDHKFDPISQADFYRLRAFFDVADLFKDHPLPLPKSAAPPPETGPAARLRELTGDIQALEESAKKRLKAENPDLQPTRDDIVKALTPEERQSHTAATTESDELKKTNKPPEIPQGRTIQEQQANHKPSHVMLRGDFRREGPEVVPAFLRIANSMEASVSAPAPGAPTRRRSQLADWITRPDNQLALRVIVNRLWQYHFGRGLVETSSDFGKMGAEPTHPELLDWLAAEFPRQEWSLKRMHKLIVTSAVYRQASRPPTMAGGPPDANWQKARQVDPDNRWLSRMNRQRLEGEAIRDALLAASDRISPRRGGPGIRAPLPAEVASTLLHNQWKVSPDAEDHRRRSIYLFVRRNLRYPLFEAFDRPDTNASCPRRNRSTIAPQALILLNSEFSLAAARDLAGAILLQAAANPETWISQAYQRVLGRLPNREEQNFAAQFLDRETAQIKASGRAVSALAIPANLPETVEPFRAAALTDFCLALFNLNEFVYVD